MNGDDERDYAEEAAVQRDAHDYGPLQTFELTWTGGHVERIQAHQVSYTGNAIEFHGKFDGRWRLALGVLTQEIRIVRNLSLTEPEVLG